MVLAARELAQEGEACAQLRGVRTAHHAGARARHAAAPPARRRHPRRRRSPGRRQHHLREPLARLRRDRPRRARGHRARARLAASQGHGGQRSPKRWRCMESTSCASSAPGVFELLRRRRIDLVHLATPGPLGTIAFTRSGLLRFSVLGQHRAPHGAAGRERRAHRRVHRRCAVRRRRRARACCNSVRLRYQCLTRGSGCS